MARLTIGRLFNREKTTRHVGLLLVVLFSFSPGTRGVATAQQGLTNKARSKVDHLLVAFRSRQFTMFVQGAADLLNRSGRDMRLSIDQYLKQQKMPTLATLIGRVRIEATQSGVTLPTPTWNEIRGILPEVVAQTDSLIRELQSDLLKSSEVTPPEKFSGYVNQLWKLHVARNRLNAMIRVVGETELLVNKFSRRLDKVDQDESPALYQATEYDLASANKQMMRMIREIDEHEAALRVLRVDDANARIIAGGNFADQFDAAFALAFDSLFFQEFYAKAKKENRQFINPDLNDQALLQIVSDLVESAKTRNPSLFEKAALFHVGSHWWLRGRYGQGPLASGLLKPAAAAKNEQARFALFMPVRMPTAEQLIGDQNPKPVIRRHEYVWALGDDGVSTMQTSRTPRTVVATLDRFY